MRTARRTSDNKRGNSTQRGYTSDAHKRFRKLVLAHDPICVLCQQRPSVVADHYPVSRKDLVAQGLDPDDPQYGRGLCVGCDRLQTAQRSNERGHKFKGNG